MGSLSYNGPELLISGNAGKISYTLGAQEKLQISISNDGETIQTFDIKAYNDGVSRTLNLSEILNALPLNLPLPVMMDVGINTYTPSTVTIAIVNGSTLVASVTVQAIRGLVFDKTVAASSAKSRLDLRPHSVRPQIRHTFSDSIENLSVMIPWGIIASPSANTPTVTYAVRIYYKNGIAPRTGNWTITLSSCNYQIVTTRVDINALMERISNVATGQIYGWDVIIVISEPSVSSKTIATVRYILQNGKAKSSSFAFINDFGGIDTISAVGSFKTISQYNPSVFLNDGNRNTIKENQETEYEINTGPLDNEQDRDAWLSFLRSPNKWWVDSRTGTFKKISLTDASPELESKELNDITFKFSTESERGGIIPTYRTLQQL